MKKSKRLWALAGGIWFVGVLAAGAADVPPEMPAPGVAPAAVVKKNDAITASAPEDVPHAAVPPSADPAPALDADRPFAVKTESASAAAPGTAPASGPEKLPSRPVQEPAETAAVRVDNPGDTRKAAESLATLKLARSFRRNLEWGQAIPLYEAYILENPNSPDLPLTVLELGRTYAQAGAYDAALSRFYSVLDLAINQESAALNPGRELAFSARYEIAQTHLALGRYAQAARLFLGMRTLPLIDGDRAKIYLSAGRALNLAGDKPGAAEEYQALLQLFSDSPLAPEARFELAVVYAELGRRDDALGEVITLFERRENPGSSDETWLYWQRRAGNQLANMFYSAGYLSEAAELYGKLLQLPGDAAWRWPLLYQVGLVAEQMKDFAKAKISYTELAAAKADGVSAEVAELPALAQWRLEHLKWAERIDAELNSLKPGL